MTKYTFRFWKEEEGGYSGQCVELPAAITQGETLEELKENMKDAIQLVLLDMIEEEEVEIVRQSKKDIEEGKFKDFESVDDMFREIESENDNRY
jgi:predicted RNase H-like HicB family nuclease